MSRAESLSIAIPALPKVGGAIQSIGKGWGPVGPTGASSYQLSLPISPGRGFDPALSLAYSSSAGNGIFGIGWSMPTSAVRRLTSQGVPNYTTEDEIAGPDGTQWFPEQTHQYDHYNELDLEKTYSVTRYFARIESRFDRIEHWSTSEDPAGFWLIHGADGTLHVFGRDASARRADPAFPHHVGEWLLQESLNATGEHILYEYESDTAHGHATAQRYLTRVCYGNEHAEKHLYLWHPQRLQTLRWHFELIFDYGARNAGYTQKPAYEASGAARRDDEVLDYAYGFELRTKRLCRQILMFHWFPGELGPDPLLVRRLLLDYQRTETGYHLLTAAHQQGFDDSPFPDSHPPEEFIYSEFTLRPAKSGWAPFAQMPVVDGHTMEWVDLYGEGVPGLLYQHHDHWRYREPLRGAPKSDLIVYGHGQPLPAMPAMNQRQPGRQTLCDLTGDGRADWVIAQPAMNGFFTMKADRSWSEFCAFQAFPLDYCNGKAQLTDLMGEGLADLAIIGPRSVRLYANRRRHGFANAREITRAPDDDSLPIFSDSKNELVAFSDVLGTGQQHLVRIRHDEIKVWPNLGHGRFGKGRILPAPVFAPETFDASRIRMADLDGTGAADLIYLQADHALILMNRAGHSFDAARILPWPEGWRFDTHCRVDVVDVSGLGCSSLILRASGHSAKPWRYDFVQHKPYLLTSSNNNMGQHSTIVYRSSAQEWLDEKAERMKSPDADLACHLPFALPLVTSQSQLDEITGNCLKQRFGYRLGFYDGKERQWRGFGLLIDNSAERGPGNDIMPSSRIRQWFHTGQTLTPSRQGFTKADKDAVPLGDVLISRYHSGDDHAEEAPDDATRRAAARALCGRPVRCEVFELDALTKTRKLMQVREYRYQVRLLTGHNTSQNRIRVLPLDLEAISYTYDGFVTDPQCQHSITLRQDRFGAVEHSVAISYARRLTPLSEPPFGDEHRNRWWTDAHDPAQQRYYINESRADYIHLEAAHGWRLGLAWRQRSQAFEAARRPAAAGLSPKDISYEKIKAWLDRPDVVRQGVLTGLSVQRYQNVLTGQALPDGEADFLGMGAYVQSAELDHAALRAFEHLPADLRPDERLLESIGYEPMEDWLAPVDAKETLWSVKSNFVTVEPAQGFHKPKAMQATAHQGNVTVEHDAWHCFLVAVHQEDGCTTRARYDYRVMAPRRITDANGNTSEVLFARLGNIVATSMYGTQQGQSIGFAPLAEYRLPEPSTPSSAIADPAGMLQKAASTLSFDLFSWMGRVNEPARRDTEWLNRCVEQGYLLPDGRICARARALSSHSAELGEDARKLAALIPQAHREPVHTVMLTADRYPGEEQQIRISISCLDGFGRALQSKQKVEPGMAYEVDANNALVLDHDTARESLTDTRWRVTARQEYNNRGLPIRLYRPYFANRHSYITDSSLRNLDHYDTQHYDALGRPTQTYLAKQNNISCLRRQSYHPWYSVMEDENDTLQEVMSAQPLKGTQA